MKLPNFLLVGAAKSGTTALYYYMRQHHEIFMPTKIKETMFLSNIYYEQYAGPGAIYALGKIDTVEEYENLFSEVEDQRAIGEASVPYLYYYKQTIPNIINTLGNDVKIIIILRNPVDRAYSNYMHHIRDGTETLSFDQALVAERERQEKHWWWGYQYRDGSRYYKQVEAYINAFGKNNVHIQLYEDFSSNPAASIAQIFDFLNVDSSFKPNTSKRHNVSTVPISPSLQKLINDRNIIKSVLAKLMPADIKRKIKSSLQKANAKSPPALDMNTRNKLIHEFEEEIKSLQILIGRDLTQWMDTNSQGEKYV